MKFKYIIILAIAVIIGAYIISIQNIDQDTIVSVGGAIAISAGLLHGFKSSFRSKKKKKKDEEIINE